MPVERKLANSKQVFVLATLILCMTMFTQSSDDTEVKLVGMQYTSTKKCVHGQYSKF